MRPFVLLAPCLMLLAGPAMAQEGSAPGAEPGSTAPPAATASPDPQPAIEGGPGPDTAMPAEDEQARTTGSGRSDALPPGHPRLHHHERGHRMDRGRGHRMAHERGHHMDHEHGHRMGSGGEGALAGLAPSIHLRYGDIRLHLTCSIRDTASECAEAAIELIGELRAREGEQP